MQNGVSFKRTSNTWVPIGPESGNQKMMGVGRINSISFHPTDSQTFFICVAHGGIWKTTNNGKSWTSISNDLPVLRTSRLAIHPEKPETLYAALGDIGAGASINLENSVHRPTHYGQGIYKSTDGGQSWEATGLSFKVTDFRSTLFSEVYIHPGSPETILAMGFDGCYKSEDGGKNWTQTDSRIIWDAKIAVDDDDVIYASTGYVAEMGAGAAGIIKSTDFGSTWSNAKVPFSGKDAQRIELATCPSNPNRIYAVASDDQDWTAGFRGLYVSNDGGENYTMVIDKTYNYNLLGWHFGYETLTTGQGNYDLTIWVDKEDDNEVYIGAVNLWKSVNGGKDFLPASNWEYSGSFEPLHADVHWVQQHPLTDRYFVCHDGGVSSTKSVKSTFVENADVGALPTEWTHYLENLNIKSYYRLSVHSEKPDLVMGGSQDNGTDISYSDGWDFLSGGDGQESAFDEGDGHAYTTIQFGMMQQWADFGSGKYQVTAQQSPPEDEQAEWTTPLLELDGTIYIAYGNLYKHLNFGQPEMISDFEDAEGMDHPLPTSALYMSPLNAQKIYLAKRGYPDKNIKSEVWHSPDEGKNWVDVSEGLPTHLFPTYIMGRENAPKNVWVTFGGFSDGEKVYASTDFGETWKNISYNLPNVPANCVAYQNDKSKNVYVGTDMGVFYLDAENEEWIPYSEGLPNVLVTELEESQGDGTLKASTFGRGCWEIDLLPAPDPEGVGDEALLEVGVFPNPATDLIQIKLEKPFSGNLQIRDITGRTVFKTRLSEITLYNIETTEWLTGTYFIVLKGEQQRASRQFSIIH
mgnify:CR=1 FL=1